MRWIIIAGIIFCSLGLEAQRSLIYPDSQKIYGDFVMTNYCAPDFKYVFTKQFEFNVFDNPLIKQDVNLFAPKIDHLPGMFCKMEYQLEIKSKLAPRFRLGSLKYTEWMEGKGEFNDRY